MNEEDKAAVKSALLQWKSEGVANPVIPVYMDLDGDGIPDYYGLGEGDELVVVAGVSDQDLVSVSTGDAYENGDLANE